MLNIPELASGSPISTKKPVLLIINNENAYLLTGLQHSSFNETFITLAYKDLMLKSLGSIHEKIE